MLRFLTAGESHGRGLLAILEGGPAGLAIDFDRITADLRRRQGGYGRGRRMAIESDRAEFISCGPRRRDARDRAGRPPAPLPPNRGGENGHLTMPLKTAAPGGATGPRRSPVIRPRPGHADL